MKQIRSTFLIIALIFAASCQHPEKAALVATTTITQSADAAIGAFNDYRKVNPVSPETVQQVRKAALAYKFAVENARIAQKTYAAVKGTTEEDAAKAAADRALDAVNEAIQGVTTLIHSLVPELNQQKFLEHKISPESTQTVYRHPTYH